MDFREILEEVCHGIWIRILC